MVAQGYDCTLYIKESHRKLFNNKNLHFQYYDEFFLENIIKFNKNLKNNDVSNTENKKVDYTQRLISFEAEYFFKIRCIKKYLNNCNDDFSCYDIIMYDYYLYFGSYLAQTYQKPSVSLICNIVPTGRQVNLNLKNSLLMNYLANLDDDLANEDAINCQLKKISENIEKKYNIKFDLLKNGFGDINIMCHSKEFYPYEFVEDELFFIGRQTDETCPVIKSFEKKSILVHFGQIDSKFEKELLLEIINQFKNANENVYIAIRNLNDWLPEPINDHEYPNHITIKPHLPFDKLITQVSLFICHGGTTGINEAVSNGVPALMIPTSGERYLTSKRFAEMGAGLMLDCSIQSLKSDLMVLVKQLKNDPAYGRNASYLGECLKKAVGSTSHAVKAVTKLLSKHD
jgi:UDP-glucuronosyltransferase 1-1, putative